MDEVDMIPEVMCDHPSRASRFHVTMTINTELGVVLILSRVREIASITLHFSK